MMRNGSCFCASAGKMFFHGWQDNMRRNSEKFIPPSLLESNIRIVCLTCVRATQPWTQHGSGGTFSTIEIRTSAEGVTLSLRQMSCKRVLQGGKSMVRSGVDLHHPRELFWIQYTVIVLIC